MVEDDPVDVVVRDPPPPPPDDAGTGEGVTGVAGTVKEIITSDRFALRAISEHRT